MIKTEEARTTVHRTGCPSCGAPVMAARNPFYGVDLAVHKYVRNCLECSWLNFASDAYPAKVEAQWAPRRIRGLHSLWMRLNAAVSGLKAA